MTPKERKELINKLFQIAKDIETIARLREQAVHRYNQRLEELRAEQSKLNTLYVKQTK